MPDTYFTRKEAIAHGEAIDPITREEALIQKAATPLSVKDATLYALKGSGSTQSDFRFVRLIINGAQSLTNLIEDPSYITLTLERPGITYNHTFLRYDAGQQVLDMLMPAPLSEVSLHIVTETNSVYTPTFTYTGLSYIGDDNYLITKDPVTIYVGASGGK